MNVAFWKNILKYGVGIGLLVFVLWMNWEPKPGKVTDQNVAVAMLAGGPVAPVAQQVNATPGLKVVLSKPIYFQPLLWATCISVVATFITFARWHLLVQAQGLPFTLRSAVRIGLVGYAFNTFLPTAIGGDIIKAVAISREQSRRTVAISTILIDRILGLWGLVLFVAMLGGIFWVTSAPVLMNNLDLQTLVFLSWGIIAVSLTIWGLMGFLPDRLATKFGLWWRSIPKVGGMIAEVWQAVWIYRQRSRAMAIALLMTLVAHTGWVFVFHFSVNAFAEVDAASIQEHMLIVPPGMTMQALFPAPGGVGGGEAAYGWLYTLLGKAAIAGILGCMAQRLVSWTIGLIGYFIYTQMKNELPSEPKAAIEPAFGTPNP